MLTIAEISGIIAACVVIVQYVLPAALCVILVRFARTENNAVTWSVVNRSVANTIWPHLLRADAVHFRNVTFSITALGWTSTIGAVLLVLASVLAPLGLSDSIVLGESKMVEFEYVKDPGPWGRITMSRPGFKFSRYCEYGLIINCPGQYQGVDVKEIAPGHYQSVKTDESSTVNLTIPLNYTTMFSSATSDRGNTISGLFDIQYRRWKIERWGLQDKGQPYVAGAGDFRYIENLITQNDIIIKEGVIVDMRKDPGIGLRNHTIPVGLRHGGIWSEDITWIQPVTKCADTNLSIELRIEDTFDVNDNTTIFLVDRGAFVGLRNTDVESRPWNDNQTLDLFGRAHKAARMHNVLVASSLGVTLPLDLKDQPLAKMALQEKTVPASFEMIEKGKLKGFGNTAPVVPGYSFGNTSFPGNRSISNNPPFIPHYPDGMKKLLALNYSAITQICRGYYAINTIDLDLRSNNISYPAVDCGYLLGAPPQIPEESLSASTYTGLKISQRNLYVCATSARASVKTIKFRYNSTGVDFSKLQVMQIADKIYSDENSKPLWAVEHSYDRVMRFDPLWGIVDSSYENTKGFSTLRADGLWLPTSPSLALALGEREGYDALAAASTFVRQIGNLYNSITSTPERDYSGRFEYALFERFQGLSHNETSASQIPSLILNDGLAATIVGTKTSISSRYVTWPATLAVDDTKRGFPRAKVSVYQRAICYDVRYAIPAIVVLTLLLLAVVGASAVFATSRSIIRTMRNTYNQTSAGRLATNLLLPGDATQPSKAWVRGDGRLRLSFGQIKTPEKNYFCKIVGPSPNVEPKPDQPTPDEATSYEATPYEATPHQATPYQTTPYQATSYEVTPYGATPYETTPEEHIPDTIGQTGPGERDPLFSEHSNRVNNDR